MRGSYKTFAARIDTPTVLDGFVPTYIDEIGERFHPIEDLQKEYIACLQENAAAFNNLIEYSSVVSLLGQAVDRIEDTFSDFRDRMRYFTLVFFGAVNSGKTSMICDLANSNPLLLSAQFSKRPDFVPDEDRVAIGPEVATRNLYEILVEKSAVRLVDVPGIGGVVHDDKTLAPFVDMADCIIFLLNASSDISLDDYKFIRDYVAVMGLKPSTQAGESGFIAERGFEKQALVILNKWQTNYRGVPPSIAAAEWERKCQWILNGKPGSGFTGIADLFSKPPTIVRANTSRRDDLTGERLPGQDEQVDLAEVVEALRQILEEDGVSLRLDRPRQAIAKEIHRLCEALATEKTRLAVESASRDLKLAGVTIERSVHSIMERLQPRFESIAESVVIDLNPQIKKALWDWKPKVGFIQSFKGLFAKEALKQELKEKWGKEISDLLQDNLDLRQAAEKMRAECESLTGYILNSFRVDLAEVDPRLAERLLGAGTSGKTRSVEGIDREHLVKLIQDRIDSVVKDVGNEIVHDLMAIIAMDAILEIVMHAILNFAGSILLALIRRWIIGDKRQRQIRKQVEDGVDVALGVTRTMVRDRMAEEVRKGIDKIVAQMKAVLLEEERATSQPLEMLGRMIAELRGFLPRLDDLAVPTAAELAATGDLETIEIGGMVGVS